MTDLIPKWKLSLNSPWFEYVKQKQKIYEGRCYWKQVKEYEIGDVIEIFHFKDKDETSYFVKIKGLHKFSNFREALVVLGLSRTLPGIATYDEGVSIYQQFVSLETQNKFGVCMIEIEKL